jgi:hypothetical protein
MHKAIFIDDDKSANVYASLLNKSDPDGLAVEFMQPDLALADLSAKILMSKPQLLLLDYRLDQNPSDNANQNRYKAGPLAQQLRDHAIDTPDDDLPIVLLSNEENIRKLFVPDETAHDLFDDKNTKQRVKRSADAVRTELVALIDAYPCAFYLCTWGCGCIGHPAFPAPSFFEEGQSSGIIRTPRVAGLRNHVQ